MFKVAGNETHSAQIAETIQSGNWDGQQKIRLLTCFGATGPAQDISNMLGVEVLAADNKVGVDRTKTNFDPVVDNGESWHTFKPNCK